MNADKFLVGTEDLVQGNFGLSNVMSDNTNGIGVLQRYTWVLIIVNIRNKTIGETKVTIPTQNESCAS